jgi:hypothetical protein
MKYNINFPLELVFWSAGLIILFFTDPHQHHFGLCPLANLGIDWCPGCGLGRSIAAIFDGEIKESFNYHWFGLPALLLICYRIWQLGSKIICKQTFTLKYKEN